MIIVSVDSDIEGVPARPGAPTGSTFVCTGAAAEIGEGA
jgi:hypothetical protein